MGGQASEGQDRLSDGHRVSLGWVLINFTLTETLLAVPLKLSGPLMRGESIDNVLSRKQEKSGR
jgi:hypothetical protein